MRREPYTKRGITRIPCYRCGQPSSQQWQICSLKNDWKAICTKCDIKLNEVVLKFFGFTGTGLKPVIEEYSKQFNERKLP